MATGKPMPEIKPCFEGHPARLVGQRPRGFEVNCTDPKCWWGPRKKTERAAIVAWNAAPRKGADES